MKRKIALLLCAVMVFSMAAGCGSTKNPDSERSTDEKKETTENAKSEQNEEVTKSYDEHIDFTCTNYYSLYQAANGFDIEADEYIQWVQEKFNVTVDQWACESANAKETVRLWVNGGTMPDCMVWPELSYSELCEYADQGLLQPLPGGWEEKWPNIAKMVEKSGYGELVKVDGLTYAIPHATFGNFNSMEKLVAHTSLYYRKDWAEQVGMADLGDDYTISFAELEEYLMKVKEAGLCDGAFLSCSVGGATIAFRYAVGGVSGEDFIATDDGYIWEPQQENYVQYIEKMQDWYNRGLLDPDFYVNEEAEVQTKFQEGFVAAMVTAGGVGNYQGLIDNLMDVAGENKVDSEARVKYQDMFGLATIVADDGNIYADGTYNYWLMNSFSPDCDEAAMERILDMIDWFCTPEGQASERCAIPGKDFTIDENNVVTILNEDIITGEYLVSPSRYFNVWGYCGDDLAYAEGIPNRHKAEQELVLKNYAVKQSGIVFEKDDKVTALSTDAKKNYSCDVDAAVAEIVSTNKDAAASLAEFIEANKGLWQPVVEDLNTAE